jgi:hypothetical protein
MRQDLTARQRNDLILKLRMRGWPLRRIANAVQMSPSDVAHALERIGTGRPGRDRPLRPDGRGDVHRMNHIGEQHRHLLVLGASVAVLDW